MAKTVSVDVPDELKLAYNSALERSDRFLYGVVQAHKHEPSKMQKRFLKRSFIVPPVVDYYLLLETGDGRLLETGDFRVLE